jgi:hypothetical protein
MMAQEKVLSMCPDKNLINIYTFFHPEPGIEKVSKCWSHVFQCQGKGCKVTVRDAQSTGNMLGR